MNSILTKRPASTWIETPIPASILQQIRLSSPYSTHHILLTIFYSPYSAHHIRLRFSRETSNLPVHSPPPTEGIYSSLHPLHLLDCKLTFCHVSALRRDLVHTQSPPSKTITHAIPRGRVFLRAAQPSPLACASEDATSISQGASRGLVSSSHCLTERYINLIEFFYTVEKLLSL